MLLILLVIFGSFGSIDSDIWGPLTDDSSGPLNISMWRSTTKLPVRTDFPEYNLLKDKPSMALTLGGGGVMAFTSSFGILSALHSLGLIPKIKYLGSVSGGGWFASAFTYGHIQDDAVYLGRIVQPADITPENLEEINPKCGRIMANNTFYKTGLMKFVELVGGTAEVMSKCGIKESCSEQAKEAWLYTISKFYLQPVGINVNGSGTLFTYNKATEEEFKDRNPMLKDTTFLLPVNAERPFHVISTTLIGPVATKGISFSTRGLYTPGNENFTCVEYTPLYGGFATNKNVEHTLEGTRKTTNIYQQTGGFVEVPGMHGEFGGTFGLAPTESHGYTSVFRPEFPSSPLFGLVDATALSSWAPAAIFAGINEPFATSVAINYPVWSPIAPNEQTTPSVVSSWIGDGGNFQNDPLINFLLRRVKHIVTAIFTNIPLNSTWNVFEDPTNLDAISKDIPAFFGQLPANYDELFFGFYYLQNQVFAKEDYYRVVLGLQEAQAKGDGIVASFNLTTVQNDWWGVPAGLEVEWTIVYTGRALNWEAQLSPEMKALIVPEVDPENPSSLRQTGPYAGFPNWNTVDGGDMSFSEINLQANFFGWITQQHAKVFQSALSDNSEPVEPAPPVARLCLWAHGCAADEGSCGTGAYCYAPNRWWSQCRERADLEDTRGDTCLKCIHTRIGPYQGLKSGCSGDSDCCNEAAVCDSDGHCTLPCAGTARYGGTGEADSKEAGGGVAMMIGVVLMIVGSVVLGIMCLARYRYVTAKAPAAGGKDLVEEEHQIQIVVDRLDGEKR